MTEWFSTPRYTSIGAVTPEINMFRKNGVITIEAKVPGFSKEELGVNIKDNVLTIRGTKNQGRGSESAVFEEFEHIDFNRSFSIPNEINLDTVKSSLKDGILTITMELSDKEAEGKTVEIE